MVVIYVALIQPGYGGPLVTLLILSITIILFRIILTAALYPERGFITNPGSTSTCFNPATEITTTTLLPVNTGLVLIIINSFHWLITKNQSNQCLIGNLLMKTFLMVCMTLLNQDGQPMI